jgi:membrane protein
VAPRRKTRLRELVRQWVDLFDEHDLLTYASAIAFRAFVALIPLVLLGVALLGAFGQRDVWNDRIAPQLESRLLLAVFGGIDGTVQRIFEANSALLIVLAVALTVWDVSSAVRTCMGALTRIEDTKDERPPWLRIPVSLGIAVAVIVGVIGAIVLIIGARNAVRGGWGLPFAFVRWVAAIALLGLAFSILARFAPAERRPKKWASAGATLVVALWIVQSLIFRWYVTSVANFRSAVGTLAVFLVLTTYIYVASIVLLIGMQLDELVRKDATTGERGILELVRGLV